MLDNASEDGSAEAVRALGREIPPDRAASAAAGKAENDSTLLREARGRYCLLLNEDSELQPGAAEALLEALDADPAAAVAGAQLLDSERQARCPAPGAFPASARRWPAPCSCTACSPCRARAPRRARSTGCSRARCWCAARRPSRSATSTPTSSSTTTSATSASACADAGWRTLYVPGARADPPRPARDRPRRRPAADRRVPPQPRPLHAKARLGAGGAGGARLTAWAYGLRALAALVLPRQPARVYLAHARQALRPGRGESLRDRAACTRLITPAHCAACPRPRLRLVDLGHRRRGGAGGGSLRSSRRRARSSRGLAQERERAPLALGEEAAQQQQRRVAEHQGHPAEQPDAPAVGISSSPSPTSAAETSTIRASLPHS